MFKRFVISGNKKDNVLTGDDGLNIMFGKNGDDVLDGRGGWDFLFGDKGDDKLIGGDGNDWLFGGKGKDELFGGDGNDKLFGGKGNDFLDGGAGSDYVFGDKGNDTFNFTLSENGGAKDYYDGGKGFDTLRLTLTTAEAELAKDEISAFEAFLKDGCGTFRFDSFGLSVRNFEKLEVVTVGGENRAPVADDDSFTFDEDTPTVVLDVLDGDTDADGDSLSIVSHSAPANGTLLLVDNVLTYRPNLDFNGSDSFTYQVSDGTALSNVATVNLTIDPVNDDPVASEAPITATALDGRIRVAVLGSEGLGTHQAAAGQLDATKFYAQAIDYTPGATWSTLLSGFEVVVLGENGDTSPTEYANEPAGGLFGYLSQFVAEGHGVVTTGWFARALSLITDNTARALADGITPIASSMAHSHAGNTGLSSAIIDIVDSESGHEIAGGLDIFSSTSRFGWELAGPGAVDSGATLLATGIGQNGATLPAIVYADVVGRDDTNTEQLPGGKTAYLGGMYLANSTFMPELTRPGPDSTSPEAVVLDGIFERAIAWAAGARGAPEVTVNFNLLAGATDPDGDVLSIDPVSFPMTSTNGAALSFDENGNIVYTPTAAALQELLANQGDPTYLGYEDSFNYTITDGHGGFDSALASLTITGIDTTLL